MLMIALDKSLNSVDNLAGSVAMGSICERRKIIALNTSRKSPVNAQRSHCCDVTTVDVINARGLVSLPRISSKRSALACCSLDVCNVRETGFGLLDGLAGAIGITPCRPARGPCVSAG